MEGILRAWIRQQWSNIFSSEKPPLYIANKTQEFRNNDLKLNILPWKKLKNTWKPKVFRSTCQIWSDYLVGGLISKSKWISEKRNRCIREQNYSNALMDKRYGKILSHINDIAAFQLFEFSIFFEVAQYIWIVPLVCLREPWHLL